MDEKKQQSIELSGRKQQLDALVKKYSSDAFFTNAISRLKSRDKKEQNIGIEDLKLAANIGANPKAMLKLSHIYQEGEFGIPKNEAEAKNWSKKAMGKFFNRTAAQQEISKQESNKSTSPPKASGPRQS